MRTIRLSLLAAMLAVVTIANAQLNLGVKGGVNMSNFYGEDLSDKNMKIGFNIGVAADYEFAPSMAIQSGLFLTTKGAKYSGGVEDIISGKRTYNPIYLQIPVHFAYKLDVMPGTRIVFHGGPYAAFGVGGKIKSKGGVGEFEGSLDTDIFGKDRANRFDAGLGLGVGAEFGRMLVDLGWDFGLVNIYDDAKMKNQNAYLSVGFLF